MIIDMKKIYEAPELELIRTEDVDIITSSYGDGSVELPDLPL